MNIPLSLGIPSILAVLALAVCTADARADQLKSPWDGHPVALTDAAYTCPDPPPFSKSLDAEGYYTDAHHSVIDPVKKAAYEKAAEAPDHLGQWTTQAADAYLRHGSRAGAQCVLRCYSRPPRPPKPGPLPCPPARPTTCRSGCWPVPQWLISRSAIPALARPSRTRKSRSGSGLLADQVVDYVDDKMKNPNSDAWNNHRYWAGLAVCAAGIARNDNHQFRFGMDAFKAGVDDIGPSGVLPRELARAGMALHYHLYALAPLIMLAELGEDKRHRHLCCKPPCDRPARESLRTRPAASRNLSRKPPALSRTCPTKSPALPSAGLCPT